MGNQIKPDPSVSKSKKDSEKDGDESGSKGPRTAYDIQRSKLEKLMQNPDKAAEFVYNVMGSSAGAGSGEFHVYRQIRRKEYARQKVMEERKNKEDLNVEYHAKLEENQREADERTAKKRAKRQKKKEKMKQNKKQKPNKEAEKEPEKKESSEAEGSESDKE